MSLDGHDSDEGVTRDSRFAATRSNGNLDSSNARDAFGTTTPVNASVVILNTHPTSKPHYQARHNEATWRQWLPRIDDLETRGYSHSQIEVILRHDKEAINVGFQPKADQIMRRHNKDAHKEVYSRTPNTYIVRAVSRSTKHITAKHAMATPLSKHANDGPNDVLDWERDACMARSDGPNETAVSEEEQAFWLSWSRGEMLLPRDDIKGLQVASVSPKDRDVRGKAVVLSNREKESKEELAVTRGQLIFISYRHGDWYVAENLQTHERGIVPATYVRLIKQSELHLYQSASIKVRAIKAEAEFAPNTWAEVLYDFVSQSVHELPLSSGQVVVVDKEDGHDWLWARNINNDHAGWIPANYIRFWTRNEVSMYRSQQVHKQKREGAVERPPAEAIDTKQRLLKPVVYQTPSSAGGHASIASGPKQFVRFSFEKNNIDVESISTKHLYPHICRKCLIQFKYISGLLEHIDLEHTEVEGYRCWVPECSQIQVEGAGSLNQVIEHLQSVHGKLLDCAELPVRRDLHVNQNSVTCPPDTHIEFLLEVNSLTQRSTTSVVAQNAAISPEIDSQPDSFSASPLALDRGEPSSMSEEDAGARIVEKAVSPPAGEPGAGQSLRVPAVDEAMTSTKPAKMEGRTHSRVRTWTNPGRNKKSAFGDCKNTRLHPVIEEVVERYLVETLVSPSVNAIEDSIVKREVSTSTTSTMVHVPTSSTLFHSARNSSGKKKGTIFRDLALQSGGTHTNGADALPKTASRGVENSKDSTTNRQRHKFGKDFEDEDPLSDGGTPCGGRSSKTRDIDEPKRLLACPYAKHDPRRFSEQNLAEMHYRGCTSVVTTDISRLKQHLYRVHARPNNHCSRCFTRLGNAEELDLHERSTPICGLQSCPYPERLSKAQVKALKRRWSGKSVCDAWYLIWDIIFPGSQRPASPYVEELEEQGEAASRLPSVLDDFRQRAPGLLLDILRQRTTEDQAAAVTDWLNSEDAQRLIALSCEEVMRRLDLERHRAQSLDRSATPSLSHDGLSSPIEQSQDCARPDLTPPDDANPFERVEQSYLSPYLDYDVWDEFGLDSLDLRLDFDNSGLPLSEEDFALQTLDIRNASLLNVQIDPGLHHSNEAPASTTNADMHVGDRETYMVAKKPYSEGTSISGRSSSIVSENQLKYVPSLQRQSRHRISKGNKAKRQCQICGDSRTFSRTDALRRHMRVVHAGVASKNC